MRLGVRCRRPQSFRRDVVPLEVGLVVDSDRRTLQARAIAAAAIICLQAANEEWVRLGGQVDLFDLYDTAVQAIRRPT
jgi:hypothetical protein